MTILQAFLCFIPVAAACFALIPARTASLLVMLGGWLLLPVADYGSIQPAGVFPWWITGIALPSTMLVTKAWVPPLAAFAGLALRERSALRRWRPSAIDLPMALWCLWPLADGVCASADPAPWLGTCYIVGAWGLPWVIGRVWFSGKDGNLAVVQAIALSGIANWPFAIVEGVRPAFIYDLLYGAHPFRFDGVSRYVGYRPLGLLENGNLYGLWAALAAFAGIWLWRNGIGERDKRWAAVAFINLAVSLASQSVGAIILLAAGIALLAVRRLPIFVPLIAGASIAVVLAALLHISGVVPVRQIARSEIGVRAIGAMRQLGRGSFLWRVSQDSKTLASVAAHPITGTNHWDWWRPYGTRPWGQALLLIGQYGLLGLIFAWGALVSACVTTFKRSRATGDGKLPPDPALTLAILVILALLDATLNAFFFSPAILAAGSISLPKRGNAQSAISKARYRD